MKITSFNERLIEQYMNNHQDVLNRGVQAMKAASPGMSDAEAKHAAILYARQKCKDIWLGSNYINDEYAAFKRFEDGVKKGNYFVVRSNCGGKKDISFVAIILFLLGVVFAIMAVANLIGGLNGSVEGGVAGAGVQAVVAVICFVFGVKQLD